MPQRELVIFTAMAPEAKAVRAGLQRCDADPALPVRLVTIGIRACRLPAAETLQPAAAIILAGFAGALDPALAIGDLIVESNAIPIAGHTFHPGHVHTADALIAIPAEKAALFATTGSPAVDMESEPVRQLAHRLRLPFIGLRAISDTAAESVDPAVLSLIDGTGRPRPAALATQLLRRPTLLPTLLRLGRATRLASDRLADAIPPLLAQVRNHLQHEHRPVPSPPVLRGRGLG